MFYAPIFFLIRLENLRKNLRKITGKISEKYQEKFYNKTNTEISQGNYSK